MDKTRKKKEIAYSNTRMAYERVCKRGKRGETASSATTPTTTDIHIGNVV